LFPSPKEGEGIVGGGGFDREKERSFAGILGVGTFVKEGMGLFSRAKKKGTQIHQGWGPGGKRKKRILVGGKGSLKRERTGGGPLI